MFWEPIPNYHASRKMVAAASLLNLLIHIYGTGECGRREVLASLVVQRACPMEHQGRRSGVIPPLVNIGLLL